LGSSVFGISMLGYLSIWYSRLQSYELQLFYYLIFNLGTSHQDPELFYEDNSLINAIECTSKKKLSLEKILNSNYI